MPIIEIPIPTPPALADNPLEMSLDGVGLRINILRELSTLRPVDRQFLTREELKERFPIIGDVRGMGLMQALELVWENKRPAPDAVNQVFEEARKRGLLIGKGGIHGNTIRITPPMNIDTADIDRAMDILKASLQQLKAA